MRNTEANSPRQRSRRSWRIRHPVEQAGTVGKRRAVPGHDRPPLDPIFGSGSKIAAFEMRNFCTGEMSPCEPAGRLKARRDRRGLL
jgi:hypothetical protein